MSIMGQIYEHCSMELNEYKNNYNRLILIESRDTIMLLFHYLMHNGYPSIAIQTFFTHIENVYIIKISLSQNLSLIFK